MVQECKKMSWWGKVEKIDGGGKEYIEYHAHQKSMIERFQGAYKYSNQIILTHIDIFPKVELKRKLYCNVTGWFQGRI